MALAIGIRQFASNLTAVQVGVFTAAVGDFVRADPSGGAFTITLPAVAADNELGVVMVKNVTGSPLIITIDTTGADTIDGAATTTIQVGRGSLAFVSDGVNDWMIV